MYQIRERIEPLLLRYNIPLMDDARIDHLDDWRPRWRAPSSRSSSRSTATSTSRATTSPTPSCSPKTVLQLWNRTHSYRRAYMRIARTDPDSSVHHEHHLLVSAIRRPRPG